MPVLAIVLLFVGSLITLVVLAFVLVRATDRLRATVDQVLAAHQQLQPALAELQRDAVAARVYAARLQASVGRQAQNPDAKA
ncbi:MAG: hypothetical protein ACI970_001195 [Myxococcota bacterium]